MRIGHRENIDDSILVVDLDTQRMLARLELKEKLTLLDQQQRWRLGTRLMLAIVEVMEEAEIWLEV